jgi:hypothetical protein
MLRLRIKINQIEPSGLVIKWVLVRAVRLCATRMDKIIVGNRLLQRISEHGEIDRLATKPAHVSMNPIGKVPLKPPAVGPFFAQQLPVSSTLASPINRNIWI